MSTRFTTNRSNNTGIAQNISEGPNLDSLVLTDSKPSLDGREIAQGIADGRRVIRGAQGAQRGLENAERRLRRGDFLGAAGALLGAADRASDALPGQSPQGHGTTPGAGRTANKDTRYIRPGQPEAVTTVPSGSPTPTPAPGAQRTATPQAPAQQPAQGGQRPLSPEVEEFRKKLDAAMPKDRTAAGARDAFADTEKRTEMRAVPTKSDYYKHIDETLAAWSKKAPTTAQVKEFGEFVKTQPQGVGTEESIVLNRMTRTLAFMAQNSGDALAGNLKILKDQRTQASWADAAK